MLLYNKYAVSVASVRGVRESEHFGAATAAEGVASLLTEWTALDMGVCCFSFPCLKRAPELCLGSA